MRYPLEPERVFAMLRSLGFSIKQAAEIGVFSFETSKLRPLIERGAVCHLYEAIPDYADQIKRDVAGYENTVVFNFAVADFNGVMPMCLAGASTFSKNQSQSPAINHDKYKVDEARTLSVDCKNFCEIDPGNYDFVSIDVEGGEFLILKGMTSRPVALNIETQSRDYVKPYLGSITDWMVENHYKIWFRNDTDTLFVRGDVPKPGASFLVNRWWHNLRYFAGRL